MMDPNLPTAKNDRSPEALALLIKQDCDLELFADQIESSCMIPAPAGLKSAILSKTSRPEVRLEIEARKMSQNVQLLFYSLQVGTAVAGALLLLSLAPRLGNNLLSMPPIEPFKTATDGMRNQSQKISGYLNQVSDEIFQNGGTLK